MYAAHFILEMEDVDKLARIRVLLFLWNTLREDLGVLVEVHNWVVTQRFPVESIGTCLVDAYPAALFFICDLRLFDQRLNQILNGASLGYQEIELVL